MIVTSESAPNDNTAASDNNLTSSPKTASFTTDNPPSVCREPSVVDVASVVSSVFSMPLAVKAAVVVAPATSTAPEKSPVEASNSPESVTFLKPVISLLESTITASEAETVPAVIPSKRFNSAGVQVIAVVVAAARSGIYPP